MADERLARELVEQRKAEERAKAAAPIQKVSLEDLFSQIQAGEVKDLNIIVKADVQGSAEAVKSSLEKLSNEEVRVRVIHSGVGTVAGCYVQDGKIQRSCQVRIVRDGIVIHEGMLASLQRFKDAVKEVASGYECGMSIEKFNDIKEGDVIECFVMEQIEV